MAGASGGSGRGTDRAEGMSAGEVLGWLATRSVLLVGLMYVIGRVLADLYYRQFGLSAGSAGLSNTDVVGNAAGATAWLLLLAAPWLGMTLAVLARPAPKRRTTATDLSQAPLHLVLVAITGFCLMMALPVAAVFVLGDPHRAEDFGIPLTGSGLGVVSFMGAYGAKRRYIDEDHAPDPSAAGEDLTGVSQPENPEDPEDPHTAPAQSGLSPDSPLASIVRKARDDLIHIAESAHQLRRPGQDARTRREHRQALAAYSAIAAIGITISIAGVIQQANDLKDGTYRPPAPWSLAPSATRVEVVDASQTNGVPVGECLIEIGRQDDVWKLWDPQTQRLWRTNDSLHIADC